MSIARIILIDDHVVVRASFRRLIELETDLCVVGEFADGEAALHWLATMPEDAVDVVVLDLSMPGCGGLEYLMRLRTRHPRLATLVLSMHAVASVVQQALLAGAFGYLTKNSASELLVNAIRTVRRGEHILSPDIAVYAEAPLPKRTQGLGHLSVREFVIFRALVNGEAVESIAKRLYLSPKTIANYQTAIRQKLGVEHTIDLVRYAQSLGVDADVLMI